MIPGSKKIKMFYCHGVCQPMIEIILQNACMIYEAA
jgi:hypothetical protein